MILNNSFTCQRMRDNSSTQRKLPWLLHCVLFHWSLVWLLPHCEVFSILLFANKINKGVGKTTFTKWYKSVKIPRSLQWYQIWINHVSKFEFISYYMTRTWDKEILIYKMMEKCIFLSCQTSLIIFSITSCGQAGLLSMWRI